MKEAELIMEEESIEKGNVKDFFIEHQETNEIVHNLKNIYNNQIELEISDERFTFVLDSYLEQPHLLDPYLENLFNLLLENVKNKESDSHLIYCSFKYMCILTKVRGPKVMMRLFPHEVADLEPIMEMLKKENPHNHGTWEMRYMLLMWLSMVCLIPFDMVKFDGVDTTIRDENIIKKPIMKRIIDVGKLYLLNAADKCQEAAAILLSKFFIRPDVYAKHTPAFLDWCLIILTGEKEESVSVIKTRGILMILALIFKHGKRDDMIPFADIVLEQVRKSGHLEENNALVRKYSIKLIQRLGTTFLKPKVASWRYQRGSRSLEETLKGVSTERNERAMADEEEYDIPESIEQVIEILLTSLRDGDTIVRWSAAKGLGRITGRLPKELADEVVGSILESFSDKEDDDAWHGACLTLAELGRRGLLLPRRLIAVIPILLEALKYDIKRGSCSVGANVRDSACYLAWSFARAYSPEIINPYVEKIAQGLLITTVFDREVNCRRAASAAFQENVGRQGQFPHGIDIVTTADYFAVGSRKNSFLKISSFIAGFSKYTTALINHLVCHKVDHWDLEIRILTSQSLKILTKFNPLYMSETVLPKLVPLCTGIDLLARHGSILAVAEIVHALFESENKHTKYSGILSKNILLKSIFGICRKLTDAKLFRGYGGELMRVAICHLIAKLSECRELVIVPKFTSEIWISTIHNCLSNLHTFTMSEEICTEAVSALAEINHISIESSSFIGSGDSQSKGIDSYIEMLSSNVEKQRCGYSQVLGALPPSIIKGRFIQVKNALKSCSQITSPADKGFADSRTCAVKAISSLCKSIGVQCDGNPNDFISSENIHDIYDIYFVAMEDYTKDKRGDIGSHVRAAAILATKNTTMLILKHDRNMFSEKLVQDIMTRIIQQSCEKIHKVRDLARDTLMTILRTKNTLPHIPHFEQLVTIFANQSSFAYMKKFFSAMSNLLALEAYRYSTLLGLVVSVGDLTLSLSEASGEALCSHLERIKTDKTSLLQFCYTFIKMFEANSKSERLSMPILKTLQLILIKDYFTKLTAVEKSSCSEFGTKLYDLVKFEVSKSKNAQKVLAGIPVFCALLQFQDEMLSKKIVNRLMIMLCHVFPIVRKTTAEQLYEAILVYDFLIPDPENLETVMILLSETEWDDQIKNVKPIRNELCGYFSVIVPVAKPK